MICHQIFQHSFRIQIISVAYIFGLSSLLSSLLEKSSSSLQLGKFSFCVFLRGCPFSFSYIIHMRPSVSTPLAPNLLPSSEQWEWWTCSLSLYWITSWASQWWEQHREATCPQGEGHRLSQAAPGFWARSHRSEALLSQQGESDAKFPRTHG